MAPKLQAGGIFWLAFHVAEQLNRGVPLKIIADVVGHLDTRSISRYAAVNIEQLRECALPVPA